MEVQRLSDALCTCTEATRLRAGPTSSSATRPTRPEGERCTRARARRGRPARAATLVNHATRASSRARVARTHARWRRSARPTPFQRRRATEAPPRAGAMRVTRGLSTAAHAKRAQRGATSRGWAVVFAPTAPLASPRLPDRTPAATAPTVPLASSPRTPEACAPTALLASSPPHPRPRSRAVTVEPGHSRQPWAPRHQPRAKRAQRASSR